MVQEVEKGDDIGVVIYVLIDELNIFATRALTLKYADLNFALVELFIHFNFDVGEFGIQVQEYLRYAKLSVSNSNLSMDFLQQLTHIHEAWLLVYVNQVDITMGGP